MTNLASKDFLIEVQKGNVPDHSIEHKFGRNPTVPNGSWELISLLSSAASFLSAATTVRVKSGGNANDTAAGSGAREVTVYGVDDGLAAVSEAITTAGASASSATTASFWRIYRAKVTSVGTYGGNNTGAVTIENSAGGTDLLMIEANASQSQYGGYAVPTATTGYLMSALINIEATQPADVRFMQRENFNDTSAPMDAIRQTLYWPGVSGEILWVPRSPVPIPAVTDIWFEAEGAGGVTNVSVDFEVLLVAD